jgi:hypothetical protein
VVVRLQERAESSMFSKATLSKTESDFIPSSLGFEVINVP